MNPKEKAKQLVTKLFQPIFDIDNGVITRHDEIRYKATINCAIIAVDEILEVVSSDESAIIVELQYWQQVRKELEAM